MRSLSDYIDDYLYNRELRKGSKEEDYVVHDAEEAKSKLMRIRPEIEQLQKRKDNLTFSLEEMYRNRKAYDDQYEQIRAEMIEGKGTDIGIDAFYSDEYLSLKDAISRYEKLLSETESELLIKKSEEKNFSNIRSASDYKKDFEDRQKKPLIILSCYILNLIHVFKEVICFLLMLSMLHPGFLNSNPFYLIFWSVFPVVTYVIGTCFPEWRYQNRKMAALTFVIFEEMIHLVTLTARFTYPLIAAVGFKIPLTSAITEGNVVNLIRVSVFFVSVVPYIIIFYAAMNLINRPDVKDRILYYKYSRGKDFRKDKDYKYDLKIARRLDNAHVHLIKEQDRFLHMFISGATGTGKTSSTLLPIIQSDLDQSVKNTNAQKRFIYKLLNKGKVKKTRAFTDSEFSMEYFAPADGLKPEEKRKIKEEIKNVLERMPIAGQMICAPNEGMSDDTYMLAKARNIARVYRIDPIRDQFGRKKEGWIGFNPLFISPHIIGDARIDEITVRATIIKDILNNLQKATGKTDAYFEGVNSVQTTTVSELLMLTFEDLKGRQPNLIDVQLCLNDFSEIRPYYFHLIKKYGNQGHPFPDNAPDIEYLRVDKSLDANGYQTATAGFFRKNNIFCGAWHHIFVTIRDTLLHPTEGPVQFDRARGLRDQYNLFLSDQRIRDIYEAETVMDIDDVLLHGGVIIFNYALELGQATSQAFGTFFLIMYSKAVLRRNMHSYLIPFYTYIDEFPTLINKNLEELFSLHRQYRSANTVAFQTLSQMDRTPETRYFKEVLLSNCAHEIIFGRVTAEEMDLYEKLSGTKYESLDQTTVSESPLASDNPQVSYSRRSTPNKVASISGNDIRYRDFQEGTVYTVDDGEPIKPFFVKMDFLLNAEKKSPPRVDINWDKFPPFLRDSYPAPEARYNTIYGKQPLYDRPKLTTQAYARTPLPGSDTEQKLLLSSGSSGFKLGSGRPVRPAATPNEVKEILAAAPDALTERKDPAAFKSPEEPLKEQESKNTASGTTAADALNNFFNNR